MSRTFFSYTLPFRAPRGGPIIDLQKGLASAGDYPLALDGIFAGQTTQAVRLWQTKAGAVASGAVDEITWLGLTRSDAPPLFRRCLALTAAFEGQGYTLAVGNFDGAGLTWGIIGFTLLTGDLADVLKAISQRAPQVMSAAFGPALPEIMGVLDKSKAEKTTWADSVSLGLKKVDLRHDLKDAFEQLGSQPVVRTIQDEFAHNRYWAKAVADLKSYGKMTELDATIFFDTAVQSGGVNQAKSAAIKTALAGAPEDLSTTERLKLIVPALAVDAKPKFKGDVLSRRSAIAALQGSVHGATYSLPNWGLDDVVIQDADLL